MEQNIFDAIMWWVVGFAISVVLIFLSFGWFKGLLWEKQVTRSKKHQHGNYSH